MQDVLQALQDDFKLFLQALWSQLDLPSPTRAQYSIADYLQHGPKRLQIKPSEESVNLGLQEHSFSGHSLKTQKRRS